MQALSVPYQQGLRPWLSLAWYSDELDATFPWRAHRGRVMEGLLIAGETYWHRGGFVYSLNPDAGDPFNRRMLP